MVFLSIGLPSRFAEWCDALLVRLVEQKLGSVHAAALNSLEELARAVIRSGSPNLVACSRQPVPRLQNEIVESGHPFLVALGDPRTALRNMILQTGCGLIDATRAVASSCAAMLSIINAPNALVLTPRRPRAAASAIAKHFGMPVATSELARLVEGFPEGSAGSEAEDRGWWDSLGDREQAIINGALEPYIAQSAAGASHRLVWEPELFYSIGAEADAAPVPSSGPIDITGRARFLTFGPYINLAPGQWSASVVLGFSAETAGLSFLLDAAAGVQLGHARVESAGEQVVATDLHFSVDASIGQPIEIRVLLERAAFDGRVVLGPVRLVMQADVPADVRQRLIKVLHE